MSASAFEISHPCLSYPLAKAAGSGESLERDGGGGWGAHFGRLQMPRLSVPVKHHHSLPQNRFKLLYCLLRITQRRTLNNDSTVKLYQPSSLCSQPPPLMLLSHLLVSTRDWLKLTHFHSTPFVFNCTTTLHTPPQTVKHSIATLTHTSALKIYL